MHAVSSLYKYHVTKDKENERNVIIHLVMSILMWIHCYTESYPILYSSLILYVVSMFLNAFREKIFLHLYKEEVDNEKR